HTPQTPNLESHVYILTLHTTPSISHPLTQIRSEYFPPHLNRTPAHITLFHALPSSKYSTFDHDITEVAKVTRPYRISTGRPFRLRRGVAILLDAG
ncbi:hypothetical protein P280DRAFT_380014, partial [Massarina eburnea CBS 473.64]